MLHQSRLADNLALVRDSIQQAARRADRDPNSITLVAVTKYVPGEVVLSLHEMGVRDFGESRPQVLWEKAPALPADIRWHLIGHWQTNKVRRTLPYISLVHSLDRISLAEELSRESQRLGKVTPVLIEVKIVADEAKHGFLPDDLMSALATIRELPGIQINGFMTMASQGDDAESARPVFRKLCEYRNQQQVSLGVPLPMLSMGMSQDFAVAIEEGATHVRVGSTLFEGVVDA
ncbi:YggS family pyridoxal phosphate-dependent enzyme [bacterium]|nr:YggS family pyridoxal phosphate-dependent enzyme [bacterium]